jgi:ABC-type branched-subunit amino acid transport system substrate-binding protein
MRAGLELWARHTGARLELIDDGSSPERAARAHWELVDRGLPIVLGPYGSDSVRAVALERSGAVVWNHGAAADDVQRLPGLVSVPSPASRYLVALGRAVAVLRRGARVAVVTAPGRFARFAREGLEHEVDALALELVRGAEGADAVLACGPLGWEIELFRRLARPGLLIGGVSPGLAAFPDLLGGEAEGMLAPVQWHPELEVEPDLGPVAVGLEDYVAAQAVAAALIAERCLELEPDDPQHAARGLRTTTFFGAFELGEDGLQVGHRLAVVQWQGGRPALLLADAA